MVAEGLASQQNLRRSSGSSGSSGEPLRRTDHRPPSRPYKKPRKDYLNSHNELYNSYLTGIVVVDGGGGLGLSAEPSLD